MNSSSRIRCNDDDNTMVIAPSCSSSQRDSATGAKHDATHCNYNCKQDLLLWNSSAITNSRRWHERRRMMRQMSRSKTGISRSRNNNNSNKTKNSKTSIGHVFLQFSSSSSSLSLIRRCLLLLLVYVATTATTSTTTTTTAVVVVDAFATKPVSILPFVRKRNHQQRVLPSLSLNNDENMNTNSENVDNIDYDDDEYFFMAPPPPAPLPPPLSKEEQQLRELEEFNSNKRLEKGNNKKKQQQQQQQQAIDTTAQSSSSSKKKKKKKKKMEKVERLSLPPPTPSKATSTTASSAIMGVDGNGTGALMKRSHTAGGKEAPLMVTSYQRSAYPIDSGKEGMDRDPLVGEEKAMTIKKKAIVRATSKPTPVAPAPTPTLSSSTTAASSSTKRLVRFALTPPSSSTTSSSSATTVNNTKKKLVLPPAAEGGGIAKKDTGAITRRKTTTTANHANANINTYNNSAGVGSVSGGKKLIRYNGPDVEDTLDYDGMETPLAKEQRQNSIQSSKTNLILYENQQQQKQQQQQQRLNDTDDDEYDEDDDNDDEIDEDEDNDDDEEREQQRATLTKDLRYYTRFVEPTDSSLAKKTGLTVNKPVSLWTERDKFL